MSAMVAELQTESAVPELDFRDQVKIARGDLLAVIGQEWTTAQAINEGVSHRAEEEVSQVAFVQAVQEMMVSQLIERRVAAEGVYFRQRPTPQKPAAKTELTRAMRYRGELSRAIGGDDPRGIEAIIRKAEQNAGKPVRRIYRRGREAAWEADQRAMGRSLPIDEIPASERERLRTAARRLLRSLGKGWTDTVAVAVDLQAVKLWHEEQNQESEEDERE